MDAKTSERFMYVMKQQFALMKLLADTNRKFTAEERASHEKRLDALINERNQILRGCSVASTK